jgi:Mg2+/citrate symporter
LISTIVLLLLVVAWGWVLGRPLLQSLLSKSHRDPVGHFNRQLSILGNAPRQSSAMGQSNALGFSPQFASMQRSSMKRRRLQWFMALLMAAVVSLVLAVTVGGVFVWQHVLIDALLVGYVVLAARMGAIERERASKVTNLRVVGSNEGQPSYLRAVGER